jgi:hypothetical protein
MWGVSIMARKTMKKMRGGEGEEMLPKGLFNNNGTEANGTEANGTEANGTEANGTEPTGMAALYPAQYPPFAQSPSGGRRRKHRRTARKNRKSRRMNRKNRKSNRCMYRKSRRSNRK